MKKHFLLIDYIVPSNNLFSVKIGSELSRKPLIKKKLFKALLKAFQIEHIRGENLKLVNAPKTRNSETEADSSLKRPGSPREEAGHLHNCTPKIRMQAKSNSSHNMSIML